jgi:hypothetical protein
MAWRGIHGLAAGETPSFTLIKKKTKFSIIYKEIQMGLGAKSYMRIQGFLIYEEMHKYIHHI